MSQGWGSSTSDASGAHCEGEGGEGEARRTEREKRKSNLVDAATSFYTGPLTTPSHTFSEEIHTNICMPVVTLYTHIRQVYIRLQLEYIRVSSAGKTGPKIKS